MTYEQWDAVIKTDLYSMFNVTRQFIDSMIENKFGRIVNISSASWNGNVGQANLSAIECPIPLLDPVTIIFFVNILPLLSR